MDITALVERKGKENIERIIQPNFKFKRMLKKDTSLLLVTKLTDKKIDEIDL